MYAASCPPKKRPWRRAACKLAFCCRLGPVGCRWRLSRHRQGGIAALEFALVMPCIIALFLGIGTFGAALYAKQLLYDVAGETARACVLKGFGKPAAVQTCVSSVGKYLTSQVHQQVCLGSPVRFASQIGGNVSVQSGTQNISALVVTASCNWSFAPGFSGVLGGLSKPASLSATATMPVLSDSTPL